MGSHDQRPRLRPHLLFTDEPGVVVHNPRRQLAKLLVLYAVLPLICAGAGGFVAYELANERTDQRVAALEADQAQRRAANNEANRSRDEQLARFRRDLCVLIDRAQPRDPDVVDLRRRYGCVGGPAPAPSASPTSSSSPADRGGVAGSSTSTRAPARPAPAPAAPANPPAGPPGPAVPPGPTGPAAPAPEPTRDGLLDLCLPVLDLCVL